MLVKNDLESLLDLGCNGIKLAVAFSGVLVHQENNILPLLLKRIKNILKDLQLIWSSLLLHNIDQSDNAIFSYPRITIDAMVDTI